MLKLAIPITIGQLGQVLMGFFDVVMLGNYDKVVMSSVGLGNSIFLLFAVFGIGALFSISTLTSIAVGEDKQEQTIPIFKSSVVFTLILSGVLMLIIAFASNYLGVLGQSEEMTQMGARYMQIVNWSILPLMFFNCGKQIMDGLGITVMSMYITGIGLLSNIVLNYALIFGHWGFSSMGLEGAAYATNISRIIMAVLMMSLAWWSPIVQQLKKAGYKSMSYLKELFEVGIPVGFTFFFEIAAFTIAMVFAGKLSNDHAGAHLIAINLASVTYMFVTGIAAAGNIMVGNHYGAMDIEGIRKAGFGALLMTIMIELFFALVFLIFNKEIPNISTKDAVLLEMTPSLIVLAAFFQLSDGLQAVGAGILRGIKDTKMTSIIASVSYWVIMTPLSYYLCFNLKMGLEGIWTAFIIGLSLAAFLLIHRFNKKTKNKHFFANQK
jgi:MATE family multidrug resistance protein